MGSAEAVAISMLRGNGAGVEMCEVYSSTRLAEHKLSSSVQRNDFRTIPADHHARRTDVAGDDVWEH
jgi:hypothetical protein